MGDSNRALEAVNQGEVYSIDKELKL